MRKISIVQFLGAQGVLIQAQRLSEQISDLEYWLKDFLGTEDKSSHCMDAIFSNLPIEKLLAQLDIEKPRITRSYRRKSSRRKKGAIK